MTPNSSLLSTLAQPQWALPLLVVAWLVASLVFSRLAGWAALARVFAAPAPPAGESFRFVTGSLGSPNWPIRYRRCLRVVINAQGLYLALMFPFNFGSRALWLPWHSVATLSEKQSLANRTVTLAFTDQWAVVSLPGPVGQLVKAAWSEAVPQAEPRAATEPAPATGP
jgi:hypothetical protein